MPGTETSRSSVARQTGLPRTASPRSLSVSASSFCNQARWASRRRTSSGARAGGGAGSRCRSSRPAAAGGRPARRAGGRPRPAAAGALAARPRRSARWPRRPAGRSWPSRPVARAKSRIWRGLTTTSGRLAAPSAAATVASKPPVASSTIRLGASLARRSPSAARPSPSRATANGLATWPEMDIEPALGDVDPDEHRTCRRLLHDPPLRIRARFAAAPATVRVRERVGGRGAELRHGLAHPRRPRAPVHRQGRRARRPWQLRDTRKRVQVLPLRRNGSTLGLRPLPRLNTATVGQFSLFRW